ncbi:MAG: hypothetical protein KF763_13110 [Cyclobacteriaceae bacterium]|nr:hypothetical protein [Cyclobacteriaceae bacterium]
MKLSSLHIKSFRGATQPFTLNFSQGKNITLVYAENGNGKTTIADAFACLCTNSIGSLTDKSDAEATYLKSLGASNTELLIKLTTDNGVYEATLSGSNKILKNPDKGQPKLKALRRAQVTSFIEDRPSERYKVLSYFIDVSGIQKSESELKKLISTLENDLERNVKSLSDANATLNSIWEKEGKPLGTIEAWLAAEISKDNTKLAAELSTNSGVLKAWHSFQSIVESIQLEKAKYTKVLELFTTAEGELKAYQEKHGEGEKDLLALLNETKKFLTVKPIVDKCPVCGKDNKKDHLLKHVNEQIDRMKELTNLTNAFNLAKKEKDQLLQKLKGLIEPFNKGVIIFQTGASKLDSYKFKDILSDISSSKETKENYDAFTVVQSQAANEIEALQSETEAINKSLVLSNSIKTNHASVQQLTKKCEELSALLVLAKPALTILETSRKEFIDSELESISGDVEAMYNRIHPNEGLGGVKLFLNRTYQSSLSLTAKFHSETDIAPQSLYSESHLDTLGICIFIALAKKESHGDMILVLDDVVMSVDEKHLDRIINLIHDESPNFAHVIISTHYRPWRERYRNNRAPNANVQFVELRGWTKERGITQAKPQLVLDEIKHLLEPANFHRENLSGTTGRFLEALLDFLTLNFQCRLKRKPASDFTLSELLDSLSSGLLRLLKVQQMEKGEDGKYNSTVVKEIDLKPIIDNIKALKAVRNQVGAHFTFDGALVSDSDIEDFAKATVQLAELLICPKDGNLPDRNKTGSYWETKSGSIRLFPLIEP